MRSKLGPMGQYLGNLIFAILTKFQVEYFNQTHRNDVSGIYFSEQGLCSLDLVQVIPIKPIYHWEVSTRSQKLTLKNHEYIARHVRGRKVPLE